MIANNKLLILGPLFLSFYILIGYSTNSRSSRLDRSASEAALKARQLPQSPAAVKIGAEESKKYGMYLTDGNGRTLYVFLADSRNQSSSCYSRCAEIWPPLLTTSEPEAAADVVNEDMLGTIERRNGSLQVTYNGWPLYYYVKDQGEGELTGQDVKGFGAEWYLIAPDGSYIHH